MPHPSSPMPLDCLRRRALLLAMLGGGCTHVLAQQVARSEPPSDAQTVEDQVKAAFLYKFGSYVEWPPHAFEQADSPFVIGVMATDRFIRVLEQTIVGRSMNGRPMVVQRLKRGEAPTRVHIMFIADTDAPTLNEAIAATKGQATLTVTDAARGLDIGCMISFVIDGNKVRFDIAPEAAELSKLKISARLMSVARKVLSRMAAS